MVTKWVETSNLIINLSHSKPRRQCDNFNSNKLNLTEKWVTVFHLNVKDCSNEIIFAQILHDLLIKPLTWRINISQRLECHADYK